MTGAINADKAVQDGLRKAQTTLGSNNYALLTEHGMAAAFTERYKDELRYDHKAGCWFLWTGTHWQEDCKHRAFSYARMLVAEANQLCEQKEQAITGKASFCGGVERFARTDPAHAVVPEDWDKDPYLLATPGGTVDLRTGALRPACPADMITRVAAVAPSDMPYPQWERFLNEATNGDTELIVFLKRWCGYCLTGDTREHALLFGYGPGGNGKSVFLNTLSRIMGDYATVAAMDTFTASHGDRHSTDLAMLRGARLVTASETEEGRAWAESRIKQMTGGDPITARFMRQDNFTFQPQFKLTIVGNHKPVLKNVDEAARRRFNIVPFIHKPKSPDKDLESKLQEEWPGIMHWMIQGCLEWQREGMPRPAVVKEATAEYFEAQDTFGQWLAERCILDPSLETKPNMLLKDFQEWCRNNGEPESDNKRMRGMLEKTEGVRYHRHKKLGQSVRGIGLRPHLHEAQRWENY
ncbi:phage/plasmid primase, P4 family [Acetobacter pasteurianus]|uniref:phage/plasmid primase, P4 family n=1 Tax=Acetobacter TaxID=434 RepID=UPI000676BCE8|nr:phage/plasmid primase, P4 family [Acetobacter pasteurianus]AKR48184.1 hypothetical protein DB34_03950 [Acetobacter pasteurianus]